MVAEFSRPPNGAGTVISGLVRTIPEALPTVPEGWVEAAVCGGGEVAALLLVGCF